jgi:hypothetical protein
LSAEGEALIMKTPVSAGVPFREFLALLFQSLEAAGVRFCVLRNYQDFPAGNIGNDIDLLIAPAALPSAIQALHTIPGVRIAGYTERPSVANVFLEGISQSRNSCALEIDFDLSLTWKGLPYLSIAEVLDASVPHPAGSATFYTPSPVHEAIVSLFASLLIGGWLKERYFPQVQQTFAVSRTEVIATLSPRFGADLSAQLADAVLSGNRSGMVALVSPLRRALLWRGLPSRPLRSIAEILHHYASELCFRHAPQSREVVSILASDGCGSAKLVEALLPRLHSVAAKVDSRGTDTAERKSLGLLLDAIVWMKEEWLSLLREKKSLTLTLRAGYQPLFKGATGRSGPPAWMARLAASLTPSPDLFILLEEGGEVNRKESAAASLDPRKAGRAFLKARNSSVVLNANLPAESILEQAYAAILDALVQRAAKRLKKRFP